MSLQCRQSMCRQLVPASSCIALLRQPWLWLWLRGDVEIEED